MASKPGRNSPCPCGSGKKHKHCCLVANTTTQSNVTNLAWPKLRRTEGELVPLLLDYVEKAYGPNAMGEAWDEFSLWEAKPLDPDIDPDVESMFMPWFLFNWVPDNVEVDPADHLPTVTIAQHYLANRASSATVFQRRFIDEIGSQPFSFFSVIGVEAGQSLTLKDLLLNRTLTVLERQASLTLSTGMIVFARAMTLDGATILVGCSSTAIPSNYWAPLLDLSDDLKRRTKTPTLDTLHEYELELRTVYYDILDALSEPSLPQLNNTDGDPIEFIQLVYSLNCTPSEALEALRTLAIGVSTEELLQPAQFDAQGELLAVEFPWLKKGNTVLGHLAIQGDRLTIDVNSQMRAEAIKRKITKRLGKRALFRRAIIQSSEKMLEDLADTAEHSAITNPRTSSAALADNPAIQAQIQQMAAQHWASWFDEPIPALHNQTPRNAAKTAKGRERLELLLLEYKNNEDALGADDSVQLFSADIPALRKELGLD